MKGCQFLFDLAVRDYDWLVVIDDVSRSLRSPPEQLACPEEHTILVTTEPPVITRYGRAFASQFHTVLTSQDEKALTHPRRIYSATGNLWFHGRTYDELIAIGNIPKTMDISTVCSSKRQKHTAHHARFDFTQWLATKIPKMEIFGHGVRPIDKKYDALDPYRYHLAIENHTALHHWTEKLADPILSLCVPIYHGCPNVADYLPEDCYLPIDISDREASLEAILREISDPDAYRKRLPALKEAREQILRQHNLLAILTRHISAAHTPGVHASGMQIYGRKQMRMRSPADLALHVAWKTSAFLGTHGKK